MKANIERVGRELRAVWFVTMQQAGAGSKASSLLAKAITLVRDAALLIDNPHLEQMNCILIDSGLHAMIDQTSHFKTVCGAEPEWTESIMPQFCVPTCPQCIEILKQQGALTP